MLRSAARLPLLSLGDGMWAAGKLGYQLTGDQMAHIIGCAELKLHQNSGTAVVSLIQGLSMMEGLRIRPSGEPGSGRGYRRALQAECAVALQHRRQAVRVFERTNRVPARRLPTLPRPRTRSAAVAGPVTPEFLQSCVRSQVKVTCNQHGKRSKTIAKTLYSRELASQPASQRAKAGPEYQMPPASWTARDAAAQG